VIDADMRVSWFGSPSRRSRAPSAEPAGEDAAAAAAVYRAVQAAHERRSVAVTSNIRPAGCDTLIPRP